MFLLEWYQGISYIVNSFSTVQNLHQHPLFPNCFLRDGEGSIIMTQKSYFVSKTAHCAREKPSCCSTLVFGFTNHILLELTLISLYLLHVGLCVCLCCSLLLKICFVFFQVHPNAMWWSSCTMSIRDQWRYYLVMMRKFCYIILDTCFPL